MDEKAQPTPAALTPLQMILLAGSFALLAVSGIFLMQAPSQTWRIIHGVSVPLFLLTLGGMVRSHILRAWSMRRNVLSGVITLAIMIFLTVTGWMIYYVTADGIRETAAQWHEWVGLAACAILLAHTILGLRSRKEPSKDDFEI